VAAKGGGKGLAAFREAHDPTYKILTPETRLERPLAKGCTRFIVTAAQNATPVHAGWWSTLQCMAAAIGAEILVIPLRYKNPTSQWTGSQQNAEYWAKEVQPYLWNVRKALNSNLTLLADLRIQPTASSPLTGAEGISHASSGIVGHTKVQLRSVPTPSSRMAKLLMTTGACTVANYTDSRAGRIGTFHHSLSAVVVELAGKQFFARHVHFDEKSGAARDLDRIYTPSEGRLQSVLALVMGDTHVDSIDPKVEAATFGPAGMVDTLDPDYLVWHDLLDSYSCNPHHQGNPFAAVAKRRAGADDVRAEVDRAVAFLRKHRGSGAKSIVVGSNHNDMLRRWVMRNDWRADPTNAEFYLETALAMTRGTKLTGHGTEHPDPFIHWLRAANLENVQALEQDESFMLAGVELGMHGDLGPNGARGSVKNLRRIGVRSIIGHSHSPAIDEGCYQVGTSTRLRLEYNHGASSWLNTHAVLHHDGKRQLVTMVDGQWRA